MGHTSFENKQNGEINAKLSKLQQNFVISSIHERQQKVECLSRTELDNVGHAMRILIVILFVILIVILTVIVIVIVIVILILFVILIVILTVIVIVIVTVIVIVIVIVINYCD